MQPAWKILAPTRHPRNRTARKCFGDDGRLYCISHSLLLAHEDKTFVGAVVASASIPWGQAKGDEDLGGYHLVWTRDMVNSVTGLLACGATATASRAPIYPACSQQPDGGFAQNFWIGAPVMSSDAIDSIWQPLVWQERRFTFLWSETKRWEGRNYEVEVRE